MVSEIPTTKPVNRGMANWGWNHVSMVPLLIRLSAIREPLGPVSDTGLLNEKKAPGCLGFLGDYTP